MKLVAVSRILNEEDVIEPFVRHTAAFTSDHVILDNGSTDRTPAILAELRREGLPLVVFRNQAAFFAEWIYNTMLYGYATGALAADWVLFLDADEFIDDRAAAGGLAGMLARVPADAPCVGARLIHYESAGAATGSETNVARRLVRRQARPYDTVKVFVRGGFAQNRIAVSGGSHAIALDGTITPGHAQDEVVLAHYPVRSVWQLAAKIVIGRLKALAAGPEEKEANQHYAAPFELLKTRPLAWLDSARTQQERDAADTALIEDAVAYRGGELRHTPPPADAAEALARVLPVAERIAEAHGRRLGADERTHMSALQEAMAFQRVL